MEELNNPYDLNENAIKGYLFEQWVVNQIPQRNFILHDWRSDKQAGDIRPKSSMNPDLVYQLVPSKPKFFFAIECKWKAKNDGGYPWAGIEKRIRYNKFGMKLHMPIHVALGIGGVPESPGILW